MKRFPKIFALLAATALVTAAAHPAYAGQKRKAGNQAPPGSNQNNKKTNYGPPPISPMKHTNGDPLVPSTDPAGHRWTSPANMNAHSGLHGGQFPGLTPDQYGNHAADVPNLSGTISHTHLDGTTSHYHPGSNTYVKTNPAGKPMTAFVPDRGQGYFNSQVKKDLKQRQQQSSSTGGSQGQNSTNGQMQGSSSSVTTPSTSQTQGSSSGVTKSQNSSTSQTQGGGP